MSEFKIAVLGECMVELQQHSGLLKKAFGGDTLNTAAYLARLTQGKPIKVSYITALGADSFSREMLTQWQDEHIDTDQVLLIEDKQPGLYLIETDNTGERYFHYWRSDSAAKYVFDQPHSSILLETLYNYDALYLSGITLAILTPNGRQVLFDFLQRFRANGGKVIFDNNYRPKLWPNLEVAQQSYLKILANTDIALLTLDDDIELFSDAEVADCIERTTGAGVKEIVIKRGSDDCMVIVDSKTQFVSADRVDNVIDTTAAGDSFSAGYLAKRLTGGSAYDSARTGHIVAGTVIQYPGAIIPKEKMPILEP